MTFSDEKVVFMILKVTFSDEKVTLFAEKLVFSVQFSREFNCKVYLWGEACQAPVANDHLSDSIYHLSDPQTHFPSRKFCAFGFFAYLRTPKERQKRAKIFF